MKNLYTLKQGERVSACKPIGKLTIFFLVLSFCCGGFTLQAKNIEADHFITYEVCQHENWTPPLIIIPTDSIDVVTGEKPGQASVNPKSSTIVILEPTLLVPTLDLINSDLIVECSGEATGTVVVSVVGGTAPYDLTYSLDGGAAVTLQDTLQIDNAVAGSYLITVTDDNGCTGLLPAAAIVTEIDLLVATLDALNSDLTASCSGADDATVAVAVVGGTGPFDLTYSLDGGADVTLQDTLQIDNAEAGTYLITITDDNGCTSTLPAAAIVVEPDVVVATVNVLESDLVVTCNGDSDATIALDVVGGNAPYDLEYSVDGGPSVTLNDTTTINAASAGAYSITVTDDNGCTTVAPIVATVTTPAVLAASLDVATSDLTVSCNGAADATVAVTVVGGTGPFDLTYSVDGGASVTLQDTTQIDGAAAGLYSITVTDENGCEALAPVAATVVAPDLMVASVDLLESDLIVTCNGDSDGTIALDVVGGTAPYDLEYSVDGGPSVTLNDTTTIDLAAAGAYSITVTDANGCTTVAPVTATVTAPVLLAASLDVVASDLTVSCNAAADGVVALTIVGGTGPFDLTYTVDGGAAVTLQDTAQIDGAAAGVYSITVTDENGCEALAPVAATVVAPDLMVATVDPLESDLIVTCNGDSDGTIALDVVGGTAPYDLEYSVDGGPSVTLNDTTTIDLAAAGAYSITVTDANGCTTIAPVAVTVTAPAALVATVDVPNTTVLLQCNGAMDGQINMLVVGGTAPYTHSYTLDGGAPVTGDSTLITGLGAGTYEVTIIDANGCEGTP